MEAVQALDRLGAQKVMVLLAEAPLVNPETLLQLATHPRATSPLGAHVLPWTELKTVLQVGDFQALADGIQVLASQIDVRVEPTSDEECTLLASRRDQAALQALAQDRVNGHWMDQGVTFLDSHSTFVGPRVLLAQDVVLEPCVRLEGDVQVGTSSRIGQGSLIQDCVIGDQVEIKAYTLAQGATIGAAAIVGPFARLREGSVLEDRVHVGNFVETKKTTLRAGAKANHLSYLGDAEVGEGTNIGAGLITCNYDGFRKHRTQIGKNVFVGSDCQIVAPVSIGDGALLGAGSTITEDIPANALAFTRAPLVVKEGGAQRLRDRLRAQLG
jgi:bifunctional UDP-N-acetylglucosamine pyrophosphorylase / glucosamine-1-phosphate N-acetyltransferase